MKVSAISFYAFGPKDNKKYNPNFNGYYDVLATGMSMPMTKFKDAEEIFGKLIKEIEADKNIIKTNYFKPIVEVYENMGLPNLFKMLIKSYNSDEMVQRIVNYVRNWNILSLAKHEDSIFDVVSYSGKAKDIRLGFGAGKEKGGIEFFTDKKGDFFVEQSHNHDFFSTGFYSNTGTVKVEVKSSYGGLPERTYYNKDGSKPFLKNWLFGGTPVDGTFMV